MLEELATRAARTLERDETFLSRHIGPRESEIREMLAVLGYDRLDALIDQTVPVSIRLDRPLRLDGPRTEAEVLSELREIARENRILRSFLGCGYYNCFTPPVIQRNVLEDPGWYTQYTPYQAEISQGRLEALLNFQTMVADLTGLPLANSSLLDEATAAAEAMAMCRNASSAKTGRFFVSEDVHPQTRAVLQTRALPQGMELVEGPSEQAAQKLAGSPDGAFFGVLLQYPTTDGRIADYTEIITRAHAAGALVVMATDLLALTCLRPPGEFGADIAIGSSQRFGVPLGYGGPHAAFLSTRDEHKRLIPGRIVGVSKDARGRNALRLALQTREQHIRREKATSNICTAQVLLAIMASMYAVYHGPDGLRRIARRTHALTRTFSEGLRRLGYSIGSEPFFDTLCIPLRKGTSEQLVADAVEAGYNLRSYTRDSICVSFDETTTAEDVDRLLEVFAQGDPVPIRAEDLLDELSGLTTHSGIFGAFTRTSDFLTHPVFHLYRSEHEMLRYLKRLQTRDLSLTTSMIPLGSCTMKLNGTVEMMPVTWAEFGQIHPFAPQDQAKGYVKLFRQLESWLAEITGFAATSLQPNSGAQGEYAGLLLIRAYHQSRGEAHRDVCLIPESAHGTNPASAVMAGYRVVVVKCDKLGNIDVSDLSAKAEQHRERLAALMVTYPSTYGVFEETIRDVCGIIHEHGAQVYMDGANMNAQVGLCRPGDMGADVCHLNLHKTFCIPHGGGGPGMGPICCAAHLAPFLPGHPVWESGRDRAIGPVAAAPYGSPSILLISWAYIRLMGAAGLAEATKVAILNANYMAQRLGEAYPIVYKGRNGRVAHEFILDVRPFKTSADLGVDDFAKRLMDYGFHAPTMSFPVAGTLMIEPTESESKSELDRFCEAMLAIRQEVTDIEQGRLDRSDNPLRNAPHTPDDLAATEWSHPYSRERAVFPLSYLRDHKYWPPVNRVDNAFGDRNLMCICPPMEAYS